MEGMWVILLDTQTWVWLGGQSAELAASHCRPRESLIYLLTPDHRRRQPIPPRKAFLDLVTPSSNSVSMARTVARQSAPRPQLAGEASHQ
jgi:hypothetical protein